MQSFSVINPYSNKIIETIPYEGFPPIDQKINQLQTQFIACQKTTEDQKRFILSSLTEFLVKESDSLAILISTDMGKPILEAQSEVKKCIDCCLYFEDHMAKITDAMTHAHGFREPLGVILGIFPWNYPLWQVIRAMVPQLVVGNAFLIKPAHNTVRIANYLTKWMVALPHRMVDVCMPTDADTEQAIGHSGIAGVCFTGSLLAGQRVGQIAGQYLKPCVLELGGSDPFIVFKDAPLSTAIDHAVLARFTNAGQICIAAKRFLFHSSIYKKALALLIEKTDRWAVFGDPLYPSTTMGPLARIDIKNRLSHQLSQANLSNNHVVYTQSIDNPKGNSFACTIIDGESLPKDNLLFQEELFGPVALCDSFSSTEEAIKKANATPYGLGCSIWTSNQTTIHDCQRGIECGTLAINTPVHSRFHMPFGGRKKSGIGLELGIEGALSFTGYKAIQTPEN